MQRFYLLNLQYFQNVSETAQCLYIYNNFPKALDDGLEVEAVFRDTSKAFDRVWRE